MRIALVHSAYRSSNPSGENEIVRNQVAALRRAGAEVEFVQARTDQLASQPLYALRAAVRTATGRGRDPLDRIAAAKPDLVHVHNLFPNFGRVWVRGVTVPLVATLHNFRPLCAKATLFRSGSICTLCPDGHPVSAVRYACYRDSRVASLPLAVATARGVDGDPLVSRADRVLVMSERARAIYARYGVPPEALEVAPNFLPDRLDPGSGMADDPPRAGWLFVGRLGEEKGVLELLRRWPARQPLTVVGDGPLREQVRVLAANREVTLTGPLPREEVVALMQRSRGLVFPSRWIEGSPLVYAEATACRLPVLAFQPNVVADAVERDGTGTAVSWDDDLGEVLAQASASFANLGNRCREVFEATYSERAFVARTLELYDRLIQRSADLPPDRA